MEDRLRKFARIVETGSFTRASKELHISQPALSTAIRKLERELKTTLFARRLPPLLLTQTGELAYRHTKGLDARSQNFRLELAELERQKPVLTIGMIDSAAHALFRRGNVLAEAKKQAEISLYVNNSRSLLRQLQYSELDIALLTRPQTTPANLRLRPLGSEPLVLVAVQEQATVAAHAMRRGRLPKVLSYDKPSHTDQLIQLHFIRQGIEPEIVFRSTSPDILLHLALLGEGVVILPYLMAREAIRQKKLVIIGDTIDRPIVALEHRDKTTALPLLTLCSTLQHVLEQLTAECTDRS